MKRVLLVQPSMQPPGGGNGVAAWVLQALVAEHRVTVLSWRPVEIEPINRFFGTHLQPQRFRHHRRAALVAGRRRSPAVAGDADQAVAADALHAPGQRGFRRGLRRPQRDRLTGAAAFNTFTTRRICGRGPKVDLRWYHPPQSGLNLYYALADRIADFSLDRLKANLTLVNSDWTGERVSTFLGIKTRTLYPPVVDPAPGLPWSERRNAFLAVGRISPEKEYERVMRILARVREHAPDLTLTIVGTRDRHARRYFRSLTSLAAALGSWIEFRDNLTRDELRALMASYRYGIHGMREEHFGMAPAEMARAGAIVWVPRGGGQMEIVGREPALMYESDDDAVQKISATLASASRAAAPARARWRSSASNSRRRSSCSRSARS